MYKMIRIFFLILFGILIIIGYIKYIENKGIYYPDNLIEFYPSNINLSYTDEYFKAEDGVLLNGWFIQNNNAKYTLLFLHGNAGNISHRLDKIRILRELGFNIFIIDYRGYGKSHGKPSEAGFYLDSLASYNYLIDKLRIPPNQIILYGESLGTAVAVDLASKAEVKAIILEGVFSSGRNFGKMIYPFLPSFVFSNKYDSLGKIKRIGAPKLFIHSINDEILPFELAKKLYDTANEPKELAELTGGHNTAFLESKEEYVSSIKNFVYNEY